jgi:4-diphosphocytidyl-2-C-methyl-D-erythritol kinase
MGDVDSIRVAAHAKANLLLRVLAREDTGYHGLETLFTLLDLADELIVERRPSGIALDVQGADTGPPDENLAYRAADLLLGATGRRFGVHIALHKHVPVQAGLGGGSSDAAATLHAVNALAGNVVPRHELIQYAARLGSDVPFFAAGAPFALAWGRGERLLRLPAPPGAPVLLVVPRVGMSTREAYEHLRAARQLEPRRGAVALDLDALATWGSVGRLGGNDFESVLFALRPELKTLFERLAETGPLLARLAGSGSALVAVYKSVGQRDDAALRLAGRDYRLISTATRTAPTAPPEAS